MSLRPIVRAGNSPWHGGRSYVDLLKPGVTEKFLEITMGAYNREVGTAVWDGAFPECSPTSPTFGLPADCPGQILCPQLLRLGGGMI